MPIILGNLRHKVGEFIIRKNPADLRAPYALTMRLPDGRHYRGRLRSHPVIASDTFWYEGFVTAQNPIDYARDEQLKRYPSAPMYMPSTCRLFPCQIKLNPSRIAFDGRPGLAGEVWVSSPSHRTGSEVLRLLACYVEHPSLVCEGCVQSPPLVEWPASFAVKAA